MARSEPAVPMFSVVMPTRNRPELFRAALDSVLGQEGAVFEVVVVNDGSADQHRTTYAAIERAVAGRPVRFVHLAQTATGHGASFALNTGAREAAGRFLCFLDDDDTWTDAGHLARAQDLAGRTLDAELLLFDQTAFLRDEQLLRPIWLEDLGARLKAAGPGQVGPAYPVTVEDLLGATGFCHLNTTIIAAALFRRIGGFDQRRKWELDRDFYLRAIDAAGHIVYCPEVVARHNVPDPSRAANLSTRLSVVERHLDQFDLLHRAARAARHPAIRAHARRHRRFALQKAWAAGRTWRERWRVGSFVARALWARS